MPNSGDNDATDPLGPVGNGTESVSGADNGATGADSASAVEGGGEVDAATQTSAARSSAPTAAIDPASARAVAAALANGSIDAATARGRLIDAAVQSRVPAGTPPETIAAIRAEVEALIGDSPLIEQLLRP